ncbi:hypothetical protein CASFOL_029992 [Castilleja foliolosa]|uniref:PPM-type phosphatase domain-containing protein n=1 Tax=Castilleja foliolosa TaxID=1961234 RepID=A0ABD3C9D0_9LAMI
MISAVVYRKPPSSTVLSRHVIFDDSTFPLANCYMISAALYRKQPSSTVLSMNSSPVFTFVILPLRLRGRVRNIGIKTPLLLTKSSPTAHQKLTKLSTTKHTLSILYIQCYIHPFIMGICNNHHLSISNHEIQESSFQAQSIKLRRFLIGNGGGRKPRKLENENKRASWMMHVSHGYHVVPEFDESVVVQREQIKDCELCFFGVFDDGIGETITKFMQSHFFNKLPKETRMRKKCKETMKRAHMNARTKAQNDIKETGSATAMVINGEKLVMANMGNYKAVICRDGEAYQISRNWSLKLISGALRVPRKANKSSNLVVGSERIDSDTEFVILASNGVWEVMRYQEAVNLVRHIEDPQAAAECLATEALVRMSRNNISCLVIRFD